MNEAANEMNRLLLLGFDPNDKGVPVPSLCCAARPLNYQYEFLYRRVHAVYDADEALACSSARNVRLMAQVHHE